MTYPRAIAASLVCLVSLACGEDVPRVGATKISGLWTNPNDQRAPEGALSVADDIVLTAPGIAEPRRGFELRDSDTGTINSIFEFGGQLVCHRGASTLARSSDQGATWVAYSGSFSPPDASTRARFWADAGSLFVLTSAGVYELDDVAGEWRLTGVPRALDGTATLQRTSQTAGWSEPDGRWAYRVVIGYRNANGKVQLGAPSGRFTFTNPALLEPTTAQVSKPDSSDTVTVDGVVHGLTTGEYVDVLLGGAETYFAAGTYQVTVVDADTFTYEDGLDNTSGSPKSPTSPMTFGFYRGVSINIPLPSGVTTDYFVHLYRSAKSASDESEPYDDLGLVYERKLNSVDISNGYVAFDDVAPDEVRGETLYTSIQGVAKGYEQPPFSLDAAEWRGHTFYVATKRAHSIDLRLLSVSGVVPGKTLFYLSGAPFAASTTESGSSFKVYTDGTVSQNIANTAKSLVRAINNSPPFVAHYISGEADVPGLFRIQRQAVGQAVIYVYMADGNTAGFVPNVPTVIRSAPGQTSRTGTVVTVNFPVAHGWVAGQQVELRPPGQSAFPAGLKTITGTPTATSLTYTESGPETTSTIELVFGSSVTVTTDLASEEEDLPNGLAWSEYGQPWAVPLINRLPVDQPETEIQRIIPTRDRLLVWTSAGLFQVYGSTDAWVAVELDTTLKLAAKEAVVSVAGRVFALTTEGVVEVLESGRIVSTPIQNIFEDALDAYPANVSARAFAVGYETERKLLMWVPDDGSDAFAANAYVLHVDSEQWTRWRFAATSGFVSGDRLYLGDDGGRTWRQRKSASLFDFAEDAVSFTPVTYTTAGNVLTVSSTAGIAVGDILKTGVPISIVVSISGLQVTVENGAGFGASGTIDGIVKAVPSVIELAQLAPAGTGAQAVVHGGSLDFKRAEFARGRLSWATNLTPSLSSEIVFGPPGFTPASHAQEIEIPVSLQHRRGTRWRMRLQIGEYRRTFALQGVSLHYTATSSRTGR